MNIHEVRIVAIEAYVWAFPIGRNGRYLTAPANDRWTPIGHAYLAVRSEPPPLRALGAPNWEFDRRRYWQPWSNALYNVEPLHPACGRLPSKSKWPRLSAINHAGVRQCPECLALHPDTTTISQLAVQDPWHLVPALERGRTIDPVTGR